MTYTNEQLALKLAVNAYPTLSPETQHSYAEIHLKWLNDKTSGNGKPQLPFSRPTPPEEFPGEGWRNAQWQDR
jgi:hypothetical protein